MMHVAPKPYGPLVKIISKYALGRISLEVRVLTSKGWRVRGAWPDGLSTNALEAADALARRLRVKLIEGEAA